ncbi:hypothetical protein LTR56_010715 [Elasticomyces elasticus]|nr:hypothetical protein LTR56_010715 [Elasticomyces elasticus]KAK3655351.1 hypothetical protein LTR22_010236 [Elasticomyces elasticus]KAK4922085.1 hypothetical protein LTR49_010496 [Elasticomyces elasticus]KAK5750980.1 hypothetical protein LTS12_018970 [Elasticomyces elasticus]
MDDGLDELEEVQYPDDFTFATPAVKSVSTLLTIAPELRNRIYELTFEGPNSGLEQDLVMATAPHKSILLTCKKVCFEAKGLYKTAYQQYWTQTTFVLPGRYYRSAQSVTLSLSFTEEDLAHIEQFDHAAELSNILRKGHSRTAAILQTGSTATSSQASGSNAGIKGDAKKALSTLRCSVKLRGGQEI